MYLRALLCFIVLFSTSVGLAQKTVVYGRVYDALTNEPLPFTPVMFVGTKSGAQTDLDGKYKIETYYSSDSLRAMVLGYQTQTVRVRQGQSTEINFMMKEQAGLSTEVVIRPDDEPNPAIALMKKVLRNKDINNREKLSAYEYEAYNKVEFDINNFGDKIQDRKIMRPFAFIFEGVDSTGEKPYLPVFMTE
ncbi:MAG: carboxypeptidase-like regulatory domain-containing protein, partial [Flavobacteriales bacterium]